MEMFDATTNDTLSLSGFLQFLFNGIEEGYIYCPTLDRDTGEFQQAFTKVTSLDRLERHIRDSSAQGLESYLSPAVWREPHAVKSNFLTSRVLWTEFDGNLPTFDVHPSVIVQSSSDQHAHVYWLMDEPIDDAYILEQANRAIAHTLGADQSAFDCTQILRPPESMNYKRDMPVFVADCSLEVHNIGDFSNYSAPERLSEDIALGAIPDVMDVIYTYALGTKFKDVFTSTPPEGKRSTALMRVGYYAAEAGCTNEEIYALLFNFDDRIGKYKTREDRARRLIDVIERVRVKFPLDREIEDFDVTDVLDIISFGNQTINVEWLLPNLLQVNGSMLLVGPPGVGKTQVALNFGYALATGTSFLGYAVDTPRRILFVSAEMGPVDLKVFTDKMTSRFSPEEQLLLQKNFYVLPLGESMYLNTPKEQQKMEQLVDLYKVDGIIFDSLGSATSKSLSDEEATKSLLDWVDTFRKDHGVFTWFIHHNRKATENNKEPSALSDVFGSQYITARATSVLSLWPVEHGTLKVRELKIRLAASGDDWYIKRDKKLNFVRLDEVPEIKKVNQQTLFKRGNTNGKFTSP